MKTRLISKIVIAVLAVMAVTGCSDKKRDRTRNYSRSFRGAMNVPGITGQNMLGQQVAMQQGSEWGAISSFTANSLSNFMGGAELGRISNGVNDSTGIRFRGSASQGIQLIVWDEYAAQSGAYIWEMQTSQTPQSNNSYAEVMFEDSEGQVLLSGNVQGGVWTGQVQFQNNDGSSGTLGRFQIYAQSFLR